MRVDRYALLHGLRAAAIRERERRRAATAPGVAAKERLIAKLDEMAERARAAPGWREPTAEERQQNLADLQVCFRERGYPRLASAFAGLRQKPAEPFNTVK